MVSSTAYDPLRVNSRSGSIFERGVRVEKPEQAEISTSRIRFMEASLSMISSLRVQLLNLSAATSLLRSMLSSMDLLMVTFSLIEPNSTTLLPSIQGLISPPPLPFDLKCRTPIREAAASIQTRIGMIMTRFPIFAAGFLRSSPDFFPFFKLCAGFSCTFPG